LVTRGSYRVGGLRLKEKQLNNWGGGGGTSTTEELLTKRPKRDAACNEKVIFPRKRIGRTVTPAHLKEGGRKQRARQLLQARGKNGDSGGKGGRTYRGEKKCLHHLGKRKDREVWGESKDTGVISPLTLWKKKEFTTPVRDGGKRSHSRPVLGGEKNEPAC